MWLVCLISEVPFVGLESVPQIQLTIARGIRDSSEIRDTRVNPGGFVTTEEPVGDLFQGENPGVYAVTRTLFDCSLLRKLPRDQVVRETLSLVIARLRLAGSQKYIFLATSRKSKISVRPVASGLFSVNVETKVK